MAVMAKLFKSSTIITVALFLLATSMLLYRVLSLWNHFLPDFSIFYHASRDILHGISPYTDDTLFTVFNYPIITLFLFIPFTIFPMQSAANGFLILNIILFCLAVYLSLLCIWTRKRTYMFQLLLLFVLLGCFFFPINFTIGMGQSNLLGYVFLLSSYYFYRKKAGIASIFLFLAIFAKPILVFFVLFFLLQKQWKILFITTCLLLTGMITSILLFGETYYVQYVTSVIPSAMNVAGREVYYNQGLMGAVSRFTSNLFLRSLLSAIGSIVGILFVCWLFFRKNISSIWLFSLLLTLLLLIDTLSWQHHFVLLIFPFILCVYSMFTSPAKKFIYPLIGLAYVLCGYTIAHPLPLIFPQQITQSHMFIGTLLLGGIEVYLAAYNKPIKKRVVGYLWYILFFILVIGWYIYTLLCRGGIC